MMKLHPKLLSGLAAFGVYFAILGLVFYYFGYHNKQKPTHFVAKNSQVIAVTLQAPGKANKAPTKKKAPKSKPKPKKIQHSKPKPISAPKSSKTKPKPIPKKVIKKPIKKVQAKSLFSHIKSEPKRKNEKQAAKEKPKKTTSHKQAKASNKKSNDALKRQKARDKGIENRYLAGVQDKLYGWPTQSNFAGATLTIGLTIYPNGKFDYVVLAPSANAEFNRTIKQYLNQLKGIGFDPTPKGKRYQFKVEIVAK